MRSLVLLGLILSLCSCRELPAPPTRELVTLKGDAYTRGLQHGQQLQSKIKSFYTTLLTASLFPYLGREQPDIATLLSVYNTPEYQDGKFAYQLMLDSAKNVERSIPREAREEMRGIADGSGMSYDDILVLNTFVDTTLAVRGIALSIRQSRAPLITRLEFVGLNADGVDNDGDTMVDEADEGVLTPYLPTNGATFVEIPPALQVKVNLTDMDGIEPATVRFGLGGQVYTVESGLTLTSVSATEVQASFAVPPQLDAASVQTLVVSAGDAKPIEKPAPIHNSFMRDEEVLFTVRGAGLAPPAVKRPVLNDGRTRPPSIAMSLAAGAATSPLIGQHFALLDANTAHKHTATFVHVPDTGAPFVVVGWAGLVWGFSAMNQRGVGVACNMSDTLDSSIVGSVFEQINDLSKAKLVASGTPIGFIVRRSVETASDVAGVETVFNNARHAYGWTCVAGDAAGGQRAIEVDSNALNDSANGVFAYGPADQLASIGEKDLLVGSAYSKNLVDIATLNLAGQRVVPQSQWSTVFYRSRRAEARMGDMIRPLYGSVTADDVQAVLADDALVDKSDSMNAAVFDLANRQVRVAQGVVPATDAGFVLVDLAAEAAK